LSFPRKRESRLGSFCHTLWIPAFAGMTFSKMLMKIQTDPLQIKWNEPWTSKERAAFSVVHDII
jgi:hypothetical protein